MSSRRSTRVRKLPLRYGSEEKGNAGRVPEKTKTRRKALAKTRKKPLATTLDKALSSRNLRYLDCQERHQAQETLSSYTSSQLRSIVIALQGKEICYGNKMYAISSLTKKGIVDYIMSTTWEPAHFLRSALGQDKPGITFAKGEVTSALRFERKFWTASGGRKRKIPWWPKDGSREMETLMEAFESVVHFVQPEGGTGIHLGNGKILTCAHVVSVDKDDEGQDPLNGSQRIGRKKLVMFPSGKILAAECVFAMETEDGQFDCATLELQNPAKEIYPSTSELENKETYKDLSAKHRCFCVGNPSNIDLESAESGNNDFEPRVTECHSGAPIFSDSGKIIGLHSSWDPDTGARLCVELECIREFLNSQPKSS
eukprot:jgi/Bigna1/146728/aug1.120_g21436